MNSYLQAVGITPAAATAAERTSALADIQDAYTELQRGVYIAEDQRRRHHLWSWLHPTSTTLTVAKMASATLTIQDMVFTAVADDADGNDVSVTIVAGSGALAVAESGNAITITLALAGNTTAQVVAGCAGLTVATVAGGSALACAAAAETHLSLAIAGTACPSSFGGLIEAPRFGYDAQDSKEVLVITQVSPEEMDALIRDWDGSADDPTYWCLRPKAQSATLGSLYEFVFYPPPEAALTVYIRYAVEPAALTDSATAYAVGNAGVETLIVALARAIFELRRGQVNGPERGRAMALFADLVLEDMDLYPTETQQDQVADSDSCSA